MTGTTHPVRRRRRTAAAAALLLAGGGLSACSTGETTGPTAGEPVRSTFDVQHYGLDLDYAVDSRHLTGTATIDLVAGEPLEDVVLDLRGPQVSAVRVDGDPVEFTEDDGTLTVPVALAAGAHGVLAVDYSHTAGTPRDANGTPFGWIATPDGAQVLSQPDGAPTWFPVHDVLTDKATYDISVTVPAGKTAVANGVPTGRSEGPGTTTWSWHAAEPMVAYLATVGIGDYDLTTTTGPGGLPIVDAVDRDLDPDAAQETRLALAAQPAVLEFLQERWGPYPFSTAGAIVDDDTDPGYALETQTRPLYATDVYDGVVVHELAHQWFGDSVSIATWQDLWLNEGFATYSEWLWAEHSGGDSVRSTADALLGLPADDPLWAVTIAAPTRAQYFDRAVYDRGALTLDALRTRIGDEAFWRLARTWTQRHADGNVTTADFERSASEVSGQDLTDFFRTWVHTSGRPGSTT